MEDERNIYYVIITKNISNVLYRRKIGKGKFICIADQLTMGDIYLAAFDYWAKAENFAELYDK